MLRSGVIVLHVCKYLNLIRRIHTFNSYCQYRMSIPFLTVGIYQDDAKYREFLQVLESKGFFKGLTKDTPGKCHADMVIDYCYRPCDNVCEKGHNFMSTRLSGLIEFLSSRIRCSTRKGQRHFRCKVWSHRREQRPSQGKQSLTLDMKEHSPPYLLEHRAKARLTHTCVDTIVSPFRMQPSLEVYPLIKSVSFIHVPQSVLLFIWIR